VSQPELLPESDVSVDDQMAAFMALVSVLDVEDDEPVVLPRCARDLRPKMLIADHRSPQPYRSARSRFGR
jgi:hypothetical protein